MENLDVMDIKQNNVKSVINLLRCHCHDDGLTKRDISVKTGLSPATVSNLCNELLERRVVKVTKMSSMSVGRTPSAVKLNYNRFRTVCLNLQMQGVLKLAVLNIRNELLYYKVYDLTGFDGPEEVLSFAKKQFDLYAEEENDEDNVYIGVGVAVSGIFDLPTQTLVNCAVKMYEGIKLKELAEKIFGLNVYVDNESNLCALSLKQKLEDCRDLVYLHISEGVGVGIICNGSLLRGYHGYGGEVCHIPVGNINVRCSECGFYGCIENDLSIPSIVRAYFGSKQKNVLEAWKQFASDVESGKTAALELTHVIAKYLSELISVLVSILDPQYLYIGGEIAQIFDVIHLEVGDHVKKRCCLHGSRKLEIAKDPESDMTINSGINEVILSGWKA